MKKRFHYFISAACGILIFVVTLNQATAQFDMKKIKKNIEKVIPKEEDKDKERTKETPQRTSGTSQEAAVTSQQNTVTGEDPEEMMRDAQRAVSPLMEMRSVHPGMYESKKEAQNFYDKCKNANYAEQKAKAERAAAMDPEVVGRTGDAFEEVTKTCLESFTALTDTYLIKEINNAIEKAYAMKAKGKSSAGKALEHAEAALLVAEGILLVTPDNPAAEGLRNDAKSALGTMEAEYGSSVYTGSFHKDHAGHIVFSPSPITIGSENPSSMQKDFTTSDTIYGMMYFKGTFKELTNSWYSGNISLWVDGTSKVHYDFKLDGDKREQTYLSTEIIPDPANATTRGAVIFTKAIAELSPRKHSMKLRCTDSYNNVLSEGEFTLDCSTGLDRVADVSRKLENANVSNTAVPRPAKRDAALEKSILDACKHWNETPLKAIITDGDWTIDRHPLTGAIVSRTINATVLFKTKDGNCKAFGLSFRQQYKGKSYGKTEQYGVGDSYQISCDKAK